MKCNTIQYSTVQYSTVQYSTVQYSRVQYSTVHRGQTVRGAHAVRALCREAPVPLTCSIVVSWTLPLAYAAPFISSVFTRQSHCKACSGPLTWYLRQGMCSGLQQHFLWFHRELGRPVIIQSLYQLLMATDACSGNLAPLPNLFCPLHTAFHDLPFIMYR